MTEAEPSAAPNCRVYWGSHGCAYPRGHSQEIPHECDCCDCPDHDRNLGKRWDDVGGWRCAARPPYYGPHTRYFGEDAAALGLPLAQGNA